MQDMFGSVRRSLIFRSPENNNSDHNHPTGTLVDKINSCIRKSRVFSRPPNSSFLPSPPKPNHEQVVTIRWRRGELIGCGAFGHVYMGMNLDSGELLAVKQVSIAANSASKEKTQIHIRELEEEVKLLKNLSHPNIVRYLGTVLEDETLNILLEFVPGGSISSLLGKFGPFPETVIRMYTKQLLLGLDYLHKNGIMHRDIKGANILVDNKGCIKLADFGASKQVVELANGSGAKSMKGTPYWMAPEVILQTGHSFSADIWSVGCTVIEMATGKPPWSQQYQEVAALFYIGTTKSHPPIPDHLSLEAQDLLLKCLHKEPDLRPSASDLLQHSFVTGKSQQNSFVGTSTMENNEAPSTSCTSILDHSEPDLRPSASDLLQHSFVTGKSQQNSFVGTSTMENNEAPSTSCTSILDHSPGSLDVCNLGTLNFSTASSEKFNESKLAWGAETGDNDMCQLDEDDFMGGGGVKLRSVSRLADLNKSFNPVEDPSVNDNCQLQGQDGEQHSDGLVGNMIRSPTDSCTSLQCGHSFFEDDDEQTELKIRAFLDEKALELKRLQTPLYEEFYNSVIPSCSMDNVDIASNGSSPNYLKLPPKSRSPSRFPLGTPLKAVDAVSNASPGSGSRRTSNVSGEENSYSPMDISSPQRNVNGIESQQEASSPCVNVSEVKRKWKEELDQELERKREMMRQVGVAGKTSSPIDRGSNRQRDRSRFASPGK